MALWSHAGGAAFRTQLSVVLWPTPTGDLLMVVRLLVACQWLACLSIPAVADAQSEVEILRDPWGIPHIFADTDTAAMHGLGFATAQDRGFQMHYSLRIVQGRLAELIGETSQLQRNDTAVDHDRKFRTFGFARAAQRMASALPADVQELLHAYCDGVNRYFREHRADLPPQFAAVGLTPEPWTPADCLLSWWHFAQFFGTDGTRDLIAGRQGDRRPQPTEPIHQLPPDDAAAVVQQSDLPAEWIAGVTQYAREQEFPSVTAGSEGAKFSHAWVVGGARSTTGAAVLVSDPQTPVRNPSLLYEFHIHGATFDARGVGVAGSPILLIGFSRDVAWGATALGADQADLFRIQTAADHPNQYLFDGTWRDMTIHRETIHVRGQPSVDWIVRETHLGPVATPFCYARPEDGEAVLHRLPCCETSRDTVTAALAMLRSQTVTALDAALQGWQFPSANFVFGDRTGQIGYRAAAAIPVRSKRDVSAGRSAHPVQGNDDLWRGYVPPEFLPALQNPAAGVLFSANHRPIETWYPIPLGTMTGGGGDTTRSWRLRELLAKQPTFAPADVLEMHFDAVNPARREIVRLGLHLQNVQPESLSPTAQLTLSRLQPWFEQGARMSLAEPGTEIAAELNTFFRFIATDLAMRYGGGEAGLVYFLKSAGQRLTDEPNLRLDTREAAFVDQALAAAWESCLTKYGPDPERWNESARRQNATISLPFYASLDGFPGLYPQCDLTSPELTVLDGGTIGAQPPQSYTQFVPLHDVDLAQSLLPVGISEHPSAASRLSMLTLWEQRQLHPAPLTRKKIESLGATAIMLVVP